VAYQLSDLCEALFVLMLSCVLADEERAVCLAVALSIHDTASSSAGVPPACITSTARPASSGTVDACSCQLLSEPQTVDSRADPSSSQHGSLSNSSHKLASHTSAHCNSSRHEFDFPRSLVAGDVNIESVFEPRPPHPLSSPQPSRSGKRCALAHDETVTVLDPWHRRPSSLDHGRHKSHVTRPTVSTSKKSKSGSRRRRSCGNQLPHCNPPDISFLSDHTVSPVPGLAEHAASTDMPSASRDLRAPRDTLDLVISSDILESMLQGAEGYCAASDTARQKDAPVGTNCSDVQQVRSKDDSDSVFL